jgi:rRNA maturation endonuclease Nob1
VKVIEVQSNQDITIKALDLEEILDIALAENDEKLKNINANVSVNLESKNITFINP